MLSKRILLIYPLPTPQSHESILVRLLGALDFTPSKFTPLSTSNLNTEKPLEFTTLTGTFYDTGSRNSHDTRAKCIWFHNKRKHRPIRARRKETRALYVLSAHLFYNRSTVKPQYSEGPRDWQTFFAITRFRYIEVLFHIFNYNCITRRKENRSFYRGLRYIEVHNVEVWSLKFINS